MARFVGRWQAYVYLEHLNSVAVELMELGRLKEAWHVISRPLASPLAATQPNWHETARDIALRMRGATRPQVTVPSISETQLGEVEVLGGPWTPLKPQPQPGTNSLNSEPAPARNRIVDLDAWRNKTAPLQRNPARRDSTEIQAMDTNEKLCTILDLLADNTVDENKLSRILLFIQDVLFGDSCVPAT